MAATFNWTFNQTFTPGDYLVDGADPGEVVREVATDRSLTLEWRVSTENLSRLRPLKSDQGKVTELQSDDGGFSAVDRADGGNTFTFDPPNRRKPLRQSGEFHVEDYEERLVSESVDEWNVSVEFIRDSNRADSPSINETLSGAAFNWTFAQPFARRSGGRAWAFDTRYGQLVTGRVDADLVGRGRGGVRRYELTTRLEFDQAHAFEAALSQLGGVRVREIPDAPNVAVDETSGDAATLTIDSPPESDVSDGDYVVTEWESTRLNDAYQSVEFEIAET